MTPRIFCAIDKADLAEAEKLVTLLSATPLHFKLGLEFFLSLGASGVERVKSIAGERAEIFLDLKLHDIPNTVAGAVRSALKARPNFITIHASGGSTMLKAAVEAADKKTKLLGVTVLTNLDDPDLISVGQATPASAQVLRLAKLAEESGMDGVICSPHEIEMLRRHLSPSFLLVVPGIRPADSAHGDQKRVMTPKQAIDLGADYLVIGRPITEAADQLATTQKIFRDIAA